MMAYMRHSTMLFDLKLEIDGSEITVENSLSGTSKFSAKQFPDRIEYEENDGRVTVLWVQEDGSLKLSNLVIFKKLPASKLSEGIDTIKSETKKIRADSPKHKKQTLEEEQEEQAARGDYGEMMYRDSLEQMSGSLERN